MTTRHTLLALFIGGLGTLAHATGGDPGISESRAASAASAAAPSDAHRRLEFTAKHMVPAAFQLTASGHPPLTNAYEFDARFAGQAQTHRCVVDLTDASQTVAMGQTVVGTIKCSSPWAVYDNGLSFEILERGKRIGSGTLRP